MCIVETIDTKSTTHTTTMKTSYQNLNSILKGKYNAEVFLRLPNLMSVCLVRKPRSVSAYLVKPSTAIKDARALHLYTEKQTRKHDGLLSICRRLLKEYPQGIRA